MATYTEAITGDIPEMILQFAKQHVPMTMTRNYKGILLNQDVKILDVYPNYAIFEACDAKAFADVNGWVHLHSPYLERPLCARLISRDMFRCTVMLTDFNFIHNNWVDRTQARVQPSTPVYLTIRSGRQDILASLLDIQLNGIGVLANQGSIKMAEIHPQAKVHASFQIAPNLVMKRVEGTVEYQRPCNKTVARLGISIQPRPDQVQILQRYIDRRQDEILQELDRTYFRALGPRRVEELFF